MKNLVAFCCMVMLTTGLVNAQPRQEVLKIFWPTAYKWKIGSNQTTGNQQLVELVPGNETINNWSIIGSMLVMKGSRVAKIASVPPMLLAQTHKRSATAKLTVLEQSEVAANKWVLFKVEAPNYVNSPKPESQLYYVVQGQSALFVNFVAIKQAKLPADFVKQWSAIFKQSRITIK